MTSFEISFEVSFEWGRVERRVDDWHGVLWKGVLQTKKSEQSACIPPGTAVKKINMSSRAFLQCTAGVC